MKLKYILPLAAAGIMLFSGTAHAADVSVFIDDTQVIFPDVQPTIVDSRTYVPLRGVFETLGYTIDWDEGTKTATLKNNTTEVSANTTDLRITRNGARRAVGDSIYPIITDGRMLLPLRAITEASGCTVTWDPDTHSVGIYTEDTSRSDYSNPNGNGTQSEEAYIAQAYELCNEIKNMAVKSDNAALLRFLDRGYTNVKTITPSAVNNKRIKEIADTLYALEPPTGAVSLQPYFKTYADVLCSFINIVNEYDRGECTQEEAAAQLDLLKEEKDDLAINFSVALNDYFRDKNVFYEGVYDEYVLDMLK